MISIHSIRKEIDNIRYALNSFFCNEIINTLPSHTLRLHLYKNLCSISIGKYTSIGMHTRILEPRKVSIGDNCAIGQFVQLDGRGGLSIGNNVNIAGHVAIYTGSHDVQSSTWKYITKMVVVMNDVWIASNAVILPGVYLGRGCVVAASSVVVKKVSDFEIVGGNPAKKIGMRTDEIKYLTDYFPLFY